MATLNPNFAPSNRGVTCVHVPLGKRSYTVEIGEQLLRTAAISDACPGRQVLVVTNEIVAPLHLDRVLMQLSDKNVESCILPDGEESKSFSSAERIFNRLSAMRASRDVTLVALGGGVIGDVTGFAASLWMRGVPFVQVPSSLLAMVDSSVGGKTAVNLPTGKNMVGTFWQPNAVFADVALLRTLPTRELSAGFAEVIKYGAIADAAFFTWLEANADELMAGDMDLTLEAVARSVQHKANIVVRDERETGDRMLLNFGHTFGHALEVAHAYRGILHGEAVAIGMACAAQLSAELYGGDIAHDAKRLEALLTRFGLPTRTELRARPEDMVSLMRLDKKVQDGKLRLILWRGVGQARVDTAPSSAIEGVWRSRLPRQPVTVSLAD
jgi:3-dehydroquinate synthase